MLAITRSRDNGVRGRAGVTDSTTSEAGENSPSQYGGQIQPRIQPIFEVQKPNIFSLLC